ncbi:hypothetical protein [Streptomyces longwoodensis]|uniref:hypothetical protein n=1 Tax=Streptomyces longwoodensis TaxID=68231 RepID=UPI00324735F2
MTTGLFISAMRTGVPLVAGWLLTLAVRAGVGIDSTTVTTLVTVALAFAYYLLFRILEWLGERARGTFLQNLAGLFLGWARPPAYPKFETLQPVAGARYLDDSTSG